MRIGLDLDGCLYSHPGFFGPFIELMSAAGHQFYCTSSHARSEWPADVLQLAAMGIPAHLISPDMMYPVRHGDIAKKAAQADQLDLVFDDDLRIQALTKTPIFATPANGQYSFR